MQTLVMKMILLSAETSIEDKKNDLIAGTAIED